MGNCRLLCVLGCGLSTGGRVRFRKESNGRVTSQNKAEPLSPSTWEAMSGPQRQRASSSAYRYDPLVGRDQRDQRSRPSPPDPMQQVGASQPPGSPRVIALRVNCYPITQLPQHKAFQYHRTSLLFRCTPMFTFATVGQSASEESAPNIPLTPFKTFTSTLNQKVHLKTGN